VGKKIRWGILGTGAAAWNLAQNFSQVKDAELLAVGSRSQDTARAFTDGFKVKRAYSSYAELLQDSDIDVVYVATPHHRHKDDCLQCLEAGKAVLCEKPFSLNAEQAEEVISVARKKKLFCMEAMWMRFIPLIREIKRRVDQGEIGDIQMLKADFGYPALFDPESRFFSLKKGGGSLMDRGIYTLSLAFYLIGQPEYVNSYAAIGKTGVDDQSAYLLGYENGAVADLASTLMTYATNEAVIMGSKGQIRIHDPFYCPNRMSIKSFPEVSAPAFSTLQNMPGLKQKLKQNPLVNRIYPRISQILRALNGGESVYISFAGNGYQYEIAEVTQCLQRGEVESQVMPLDETLAIMQTMDAMRDHWGLRYPPE